MLIVNNSIFSAQEGQHEQALTAGAAYAQFLQVHPTIEGNNEVQPVDNEVNNVEIEESGDASEATSSTAKSSN
jgi:hypothetical protein